ncbi:MAG: phage baseplate assembly protein V, partial [Chloroflexaceae bacterium]|nr:phage baseplate assembly protein V [Chloroflexaceae bacterium]
LVIGIVTDNKDPDKLGRVKVKFPWLTTEHASHWARVVSVGAGNGRGVLFIPEVNDEVLVGFEQDSPNTPYVLGGLWNGKDKPPAAGSNAVDGGGNVQQRLISSRVGHELVMGENAAGGDGFVHLKTKAGRIVKISDTDKGVLIKTDNHSVKLDDQGRLLAIESGGDLNIKANGKVSIEGQTGVEVKSNTTMALNANATMEIKANATMAISSNAPMDVKSSAILNLQGTLVKIN